MDSKQHHNELSERAAEAGRRVAEVLKRINEALSEKPTPAPEENPVAYRNGNGERNG
jgi:hypothetical protein